MAAAGGAAADVGGIKFEGVDLFLAEPHTSIDSPMDKIKRLAVWRAKEAESRA